MTQLVRGFALLALVACQAPAASPPVPTSEALALLRVFDTLATQAPAETLHLAAPAFEAIPDPPGRPVSADQVPLLRALYPAIQLTDSVYPVYRLTFGSVAIGYVLQVPADLSPAYHLAVYHRRLGRWLAPVRLAYAFGDAGDYLNSEAWVVPVGQDRVSELVLRYKAVAFDLDKEDVPPNRVDSLTVLRVTDYGTRLEVVPRASEFWARFDIASPAP